MRLTQKPFLEANVGNPALLQGMQVAVPLRLAARIDQGLGRQAVGRRRQGQGSSWRRRAMTARRWCCCTRPTWSATTTSPRSPSRSSRRPGFKVDLQAMDWQTLVARRTKKDPPDKGGWRAFFTSWGALSIPDPVSALLPQRLVRQGDVRLAVRCRDREAARRLCARNRRSGQAEGDRRAGPAARAASIRPMCRSASSRRRRRRAPTSAAC